MSEALSPAPRHRFERHDAEPDDFFTIDVGGNIATVFRPIQGKEKKRSTKYYVKRGGFFRCTGFATKGDAREKARLLFKAFLEKRFEALDATKLRKPAPAATIGELIAAHEKGIARANRTLMKKSADGYRNSLRRVVAWGKLGGLEDGWQKRTEAMSGTVLDGELVRDYLVAVVPAKEANPKRHEEALRGALRTLALARQMFADRKCFAAGALPPKLEEFLERPSEKAPRRRHEALADASLREMAQAGLALRESNPALYAVHLLFRHLGMRNDEIVHARAEWIVRLAKPQEVFLFDGTKREVAAFMVIENRDYWAVKKSGGRVPISADVLAEIEGAIGTLGDRSLPPDGKAHLIPAATLTDRWELVNVAHNDFVRPWTEHLQKRSYELRRWAGTKVRMMHRSREMGDVFLRHAPTSVGELHYFTDAPVPAPITLADVCDGPMPDGRGLAK